MDKALKIIDRLTASNNRLTATNESQQRSLADLTGAFQNLTHKEIEALPPSLKLVALNGELVK